jgi:pilus assembly protein CpaD
LSCATIIRTIRATLATIRLSYPKISAVAGPCGLWPEDLGPSIKNKSYNENKPYYNFGCAYQRNLAAMVDNPADLVQPRPETPPIRRGARRVREISQGHSTTTTYPEADKAKLSDTGK